MFRNLFNENFNTYYYVTKKYWNYFFGGHVITISICFYMVSLAQPWVDTGKTLVLAHKYCITNMLYIKI